MSLLATSSSKAMEFAGCSQENPLPARWSAMQSSRELTAICVSGLNLSFSSRVRSGRPNGASYVRRGCDGLPLLSGISWAAEKVLHRGARWFSLARC